MIDCPTCEYHKQRAQIWRDEAYRLAGHPLPERKKEWVGLTDEEINGLWEMAQMFKTPKHFYLLMESKLKEKNT